MRVDKLIDLLKRFDPEAEVHLSVSMPGRVISTHENLWVGDYGGGPQINASLDFKQFHVYVGCGIEQFVTSVPAAGSDTIVQEEIETPIDLGQYESGELSARVRDFYVYHNQLDEPLGDPEFDYENWIPPRTLSGEYNEHVAKILRDKLLGE